MINKLKEKIDAAKDKVYDVFGRDKSGENLYETRWVWYHSALVIELFIIIVLLGYILLAL